MADMPARRLPWFKLWPESMRHEKIALLSDGTFRTWVMVLSSGSEQSVRWHFASVKHAASVTGRPVKHIRELIRGRLIDETPTGELWVHDWRQWQERYESDFAPRTPPEGSANAPQSLPPELRGEKKETERETDVETQPKSFPNGKDLAADAADRDGGSVRPSGIPADVVAALSSLPADLNARAFHDLARETLEGLGFECKNEIPVTDRGDGRPGRYDLRAERDGLAIAFEFDDRTPRKRSGIKLASVQDAARVILLRFPFEGPMPKVEGIDLVLGAGRIALPKAAQQPQAVRLATPADIELWKAARATLNGLMLKANWERHIRPIEPLGRTEEGALVLRAPPDGSKYRTYIARALVDAGDEAGSRVAIVE